MALYVNAPRQALPTCHHIYFFQQELSGTGHSHTQTRAHFTDVNPQAQSATSAGLAVVNELPGLALKLFLAVPIC